MGALERALAKGREIGEASQSFAAAQDFVRRHLAAGDLEWGDVRTLTQRMGGYGTTFFAWADALVHGGQDLEVVFEPDE